MKHKFDEDAFYGRKKVPPDWIEKVGWWVQFALVLLALWGFFWLLDNTNHGTSSSETSEYFS